MRRALAVIKRTVVAFYDDQMTQHAGAITYYSLMSLFPVILLALSILGVVGEYPRTYDAIVRYLSDVAPDSVVQPIDDSLRDAFKHKSTATTGLVLSTLFALWGTTGVLESMRRALNVAFRVQGGRSFVRRKAIDVLSTFVLLTLTLATLVFVVVGRSLAEDILRLVGADENAAAVWTALRWPAAVASALLGFAYVYYVTPDYRRRAFHLVTPGAVLGVVGWLVVSWGLSEYISNVVNVGALYGAFTGAIVVVIWLWLSSCALLLGAELNASILIVAGRSPDGGPLGPDGEPVSLREPRARRRLRRTARGEDVDGEEALDDEDARDDHRADDDEAPVDAGPPKPGTHEPAAAPRSADAVEAADDDAADEPPLAEDQPTVAFRPAAGAHRAADGDRGGDPPR
jgi:membrane protein